MEENGKSRVLSAPVGFVLNEQAEFNIVSESDVKSMTLYFKPTIIRDEFTVEAIRSGIFDKFTTAGKVDEKMTYQEKFFHLTNDDIRFDSSFSHNMVYQDALLLLRIVHGENAKYCALTMQQLAMYKRLIMSIAYEIREQPDNFWILRTRYFVIATLFTITSDFFVDYRQNEIYEDPLVAQVTLYLWRHIKDEITLETILRFFSVNKNTLNEAFNKEVNMSCMAYLEHMRINFSRYLLQFRDESVSEISLECGYPDTNYFSKVFKKHTGLTPTEFRKQMRF